jgi:hypothetical protein
VSAAGFAAPWPARRVRSSRTDREAAVVAGDASVAPFAPVRERADGASPGRPRCRVLRWRRGYRRRGRMWSANTVTVCIVSPTDLPATRTTPRTLPRTSSSGCSGRWPTTRRGRSRVGCTGLPRICSSTACVGSRRSDSTRSRRTPNASPGERPARRRRTPRPASTPTSRRRLPRFPRLPRCGGPLRHRAVVLRRDRPDSRG